MAEMRHVERPLTFALKLQRLNWFVVALVAAIAGLGALMLYSIAGGSFEPWAGAHLGRFGFCLVVLLAVSLIDIRIWLRFAYVIYGAAFLLLVLVPIAGVEAMGAQRWLEVAGIQVQPSEFMKIALVLALAAYFQRLGDRVIGKPHLLIIPLLLIVAPAALIAKQPDLGTAGLVFLGGMAVMFLAGAHWAYFTAGGIAACASLPIAWQLLRDYQKQRILTFLEPERDPLGAGYHILQSKIAVGSGGFDGKGLMNGTQSQLNFLPEKHTDFIFTTLAEELGLVGACVLLGLYAAVLGFGLYAAWRSENQFGRLLAAGVSFTFFLYIFINVAMVTGLVPVVGVPLPLVSYGGTAMLTLMTGLGLVLNVALHRGVLIENAPASVPVGLPRWPGRG